MGIGIIIYSNSKVVTIFTLAETLTNEHVVETVFRLRFYVNHFPPIPPLFKVIFP